MEGLVAIGAAVVLYCVLMVRFTPLAVESDEVKRRLGFVKKTNAKGYNAVDEEMSKPFSERVFKPVLLVLSKRFKRLIPKSKNGSQKHNEMKNKLNQAGIAMSVDEYHAITLAAMSGGGLFSIFIILFSSLNASDTVLVIVLGFLLPLGISRYHISLKKTKRQYSIEKQLPDVLDLLSISVEAGLGFEQAIHHIIDNMEGPFVDELAVTYWEMSMGRTRKDALTLLGERCGVNEVRSFVGALIQGGQLGISIKNILHSQAASMRLTKKNKVQEKAVKISTKILFPMVAFIFPVIFIILLGPSLINIMKNL